MRLALSPVYAALLLTAFAAPASAQIVEAVGSRALGMGGAFVAVANDGSASWWNPGALAAGPFLELGGGLADTEFTEAIPARRDRVWTIAAATPPFGFSVYRLQITQIQPPDSTEGQAADREHRLANVSVRSLEASQIGVTVLRTLVTGVHVGTTLKYVRGTLRTDVEDSSLPVDDLLERAGALSGEKADDRFDLDLGVLAVVGPMRLGGLVRNLAGPAFEAESGVRIQLPRQIRLGAAYDAEAAGGPPLMIALDVDARRYASGSGDRRMVALGMEQWLSSRRVGVRGGIRLNTVGDNGVTATVGGSVALRPGMYVDGHLAGGGSTSDRGWGVAARLSF